MLRRPIAWNRSAARTQDTIYDKFVQLAAEKARARIVGSPQDPATQQGPQACPLPPLHSTYPPTYSL
jgi:hypothetical protein